MEYFSKLQNGHKLLYDYFTIREVVLILLLMLLSPSEQAIQHRRIEGGVGRDTTFYCNSVQCTWYYGGPSGSASINPGTLSGVSHAYDTLTIEDVVADHEGVYRCEYNGGQDIFNLSVVAVPTFDGCSPQLNCNPGTTLHFSEDSFVYLSHFSQYAVTSSKLNQTSFDGILLYRKSPKGKFIWEYSLIVYKHQPDGIVERLLDKALYTGWTRDLLDFVVEFEKDKDFLTLDTSLASTYLNGWKIKERNPPLKYHRKQIESYQSIHSNMQFLLVWTGEGPPTTQFIDLLLHGAEQPNVISFVTNSDDDTDGNKVIGTSGGIIPPNEDLLFHTRNIHQVLLLCHHLGIEDVDCEKIKREKSNNVEEQKIIVLKTWLERAERTWKDS